jgi:uncharacterized sulfatase
MGELFEVLDNRSKRSNTLTIIVADHGDGLGEHGYMGHAFVAYQELAHVPLIVDWPERWPQAERVETPVSTRRVFHTMLEAAGEAVCRDHRDTYNEVRRFTLRHSVNGRDPEQGTAYCEVYPPLNFVRAIEQRTPHLLEQFRCLSERRAIVKVGEETTYKLIHVDDQPDELFDLCADPMELIDMRGDRLSLTAALDDNLRQMVTSALVQRDHQSEEAVVDFENDAQLQHRLRGLGYLD